MVDIRQANPLQSQLSLVEMASQQLQMAEPPQLQQLQQILRTAFQDFFQSVAEDAYQGLMKAAMSRMPGPGSCPPPPMEGTGAGRLSLQIPLPGKAMPPDSFQKARHINTEADWPAYANAIKSRITGSQANCDAIHCNGQNIWNQPGNVEERAAVGWVMQQNENLKYDADRKQFYQTFPDGSTRDVASLSEITNVIQQNGGANQNNAKAFQAVGSFINDRVGSLPPKTEDGGVLNFEFPLQGGNAMDWLCHGKNEILGCEPQEMMQDPEELSAAGVDSQSSPATLNSYPTVPHVNTEADWAAYSRAIDSRMVGSEANKQAVHLGGQNIWTAQGGNLEERAGVGWALQQNENLRYDADRKQFFITRSDGSTQDVASLDDVTNVIRQNGGANQNNPKAVQAVGSFLDNAVKNAPEAAPQETPEFGTLAFMARVRDELTRAL